MPVSETPRSASLLFALLLSLTVALPAPAQQILVQNGATATVTNSGVWNLRDATMDFGNAGATARLEESADGRVTNGRLEATRTLNSPFEADPAGLGATISTVEDLGDVTVTRGHVAQTGGGNASVERFYDIVPAGSNSGLDAILQFQYADAERNGLSESELELFKSTDGGTSWTRKGANGRDAEANTVTLGGIESFSRWTLGSASQPLPVELARLDATTTRADGTREAAVRLTWTTVSEQNNAGFEIQRRAAAEDTWTQVGYRESKADGGTTSDGLSYRFTDETLPYSADTLSYRLRQVDTDGSATLSDPVRVRRSGVSGLQLRKTFPNPARTRVTVRFAMPAETDTREATLRLYDVLGRQVQTVTAPAEAGRHEKQLSVSNLSSGVYVLRLRAGGETRTRRLTVVR